MVAKGAKRREREGREKRSKEKENKMEEFTGAHTGATKIAHTIPIFGSSSGGCLQRIIIEKCIKTHFFIYFKLHKNHLHACIRV